MAVDILGSLHHLPDLVIDNILKRLPTKIAMQVSFVSKQWEAPISSNPVLNIDEDDDLNRSHNLNRYSDYVHQHNRFINFLRGYSKHRDYKMSMDKLRLHMTMYTCQEDDESIEQDFVAINRWVQLAIEGDVKELDISLLQIVDEQHEDEEDMLISECPATRTLESCNYNLYCILLTTFVDAKSLTSLKLEFMNVQIPADIECDYSHHTLLPSLKTLSFKSVILHGAGYSFFRLLLASSSIEYVSLTACCFVHDAHMEVKSVSLKCLEVKDCQGLKSISVDKTMNLESLIFVSTKCMYVMVHDASKLKKIDICVGKLGELYLSQCHRELKVTINTQINLRRFEFHGSLEAQVYVKACWKSIIRVSQLWDQEWFLPNPKNLFTLIEFLQGFGCCKKVWLCTRDSKALVIPESFRKTIGTFPTPLPESCTLNVAMPNPPNPGGRNYLDLHDSINWIAHSARIVKQNPRWLLNFYHASTHGSDGTWMRISS